MKSIKEVFSNFLSDLRGGELTDEKTDVYFNALETMPEPADTSAQTAELMAKFSELETEKAQLKKANVQKDAEAWANTLTQSKKITPAETPKMIALFCSLSDIPAETVTFSEGDEEKSVPSTLALFREIVEARTPYDAFSEGEMAVFANVTETAMEGDPKSANADRVKRMLQAIS